MQDRSAAATDQLRAAAAMSGVAVEALRTGLVLCAVAAFTDWLFAAIGSAGLATHAEGLALTGLAVAGACRPRAASRWLLPPGRATIAAALFAAIGAADAGFQDRYAEVAPAIVFVAALVSSSRWVLATVAVSVAGYLLDLAIGGRSVSWMVAGAGQSTVATQLADLVLNATVGLLLIALLRRFVERVPQTLEEARSGGRAITPELALAVRDPLAQLPRADARALIEPLSPAELTVLEMLADGHAPKQAAHELSLAVSTVRSHIAASKRKTGARTLEQLVAVYAEAVVGG